MNMNFFEWIRNSVRQSVLLGFSDAVEQIGLPAEEDELSPAMVALLNNETPGQAKKKKPRSGGRKRLGKTLKDMNPSS